MDIVDTRYASTEDGVHIAYQVVGDGPVDIVFVHAFVTHLELMWDLPSFEQLIRSLSSFARVILFDSAAGSRIDSRRRSRPSKRAWTTFALCSMPSVPSARCCSA